MERSCPALNPIFSWWFPKTTGSIWGVTGIRLWIRPGWTNWHRKGSDSPMRIRHRRYAVPRASILTGLYPHQNGQLGLATHKYAMYEKFPNIPALLKPEGYRTGIIGKLHINPESTFPFDFWWNDRNYISFAHRDMQKATTMADGFINASDTPFFLMVNYPDAHLPFLHQECGLPETPYTADAVETLPFIGIDTPRLRQHTADYYNCMPPGYHQRRQYQDATTDPGQSDRKADNQPGYRLDQNGPEINHVKTFFDTNDTV